MPMSLGFWEWGMSKRGNAHITVTGTPLQFLSKKPGEAITHIVIKIEE